ncbi:PrsW family intramembrane metalloprotease [Nocardiopsis coralliicola]
MSYTAPEPRPAASGGTAEPNTGTAGDAADAAAAEAGRADARAHPPAAGGAAVPAPGRPADGAAPPSRGAPAGAAHAGATAAHAADDVPHDDTVAPGASKAAVAVLIAACAAGGLFIGVSYLGRFREFVAGAAVAALALLVVGVVAFWLLRRIRPVRPPSRRTALIAVAWGGLAATGGAMIANSGLGTVWNTALGLQAGTAWGAALSAPVSEELLKLAGVVVIAVAWPSAVRGPVDGFVVGSLVGLGFELVENLTYALNAIIQAGAVAELEPVLSTTFIRVILTGLGSHWAMSAVAGTAVGLLAAARWRPRAGTALGAALLVLAAMSVHGLFDSPLMESWGFIGIAIKVLTVFAAALAVYFTVRHGYRTRVLRALESEGARHGLDRREARALGRRHGRRKALKRLPRSDRPGAWARQTALVADAERAASARP